MIIDKLKTKFANGAWINNIKTFFEKINEIIDYLNNNPISEPVYKVYSAILNQEDENAPVVTTVFENTFGKNPSFLRYGPGRYGILLEDVVEEKTIFHGKNKIVTFWVNEGETTISTSKEIYYGIGGTGELYFHTYSTNEGFQLTGLQDNILDGWSTWIEIKVKI